MKPIRITYYISIAIIITLPFILSNCEEVIEDFSLQQADPQLVIEAQCIGNSDSVFVKISKTANYLDAKEYPKITGAMITLSFNELNLTIPEIDPGLYALKHSFPENTQYTLSVSINNTTYTAKSFMPKSVPITNISYRVSEYSRFLQKFPGELYYVVKMSFLDPPQEQNYYRIQISKNDTLYNSANDLQITDDIYFSSDTLDYEPFYFFKENDTVQFNFISIDKANYLYYTTLIRATSSTGNFSVPDNPTSNFSGKILGHFIAYSFDSKRVIISNTSLKKE